LSKKGDSFSGEVIKFLSPVTLFQNFVAHFYAQKVPFLVKGDKKLSPGDTFFSKLSPLSAQYLCGFAGFR
jgi:hypothetical protein